MDIAEILRSIPSLGDADTERILAWVTAIMTVLAFVGWALDALLPRLRAHAEATETKTDDRIVSWLERLVAVLGLVNAVVPRPRLGEPPKDKPDIGPLAVLLVLSVSAIVQGCGVGVWQSHSMAAQTSHDVAVTGRAVIMGERRRVLLQAGRGAEDIPAAVVVAANRWDTENRVLVESYNLFATVSNQYARSVFAAMRGEADDLSELRRLAGSVADAWNAVAAIIDEATDTGLPRIPDWLLDFLRAESRRTQ